MPTARARQSTKPPSTRKKYGLASRSFVCSFFFLQKTRKERRVALSVACCGASKETLREPPIGSTRGGRQKKEEATDLTARGHVDGKRH